MIVYNIAISSYYGFLLTSEINVDFNLIEYIWKHFFLTIRLFYIIKRDLKKQINIKNKLQENSAIKNKWIADQMPDDVWRRKKTWTIFLLYVNSMQRNGCDLRWDQCKMWMFKTNKLNESQPVASAYIL